MAFFWFKSNIFRLMVLNARDFVLFFNLLKIFWKKITTCQSNLI